ncbi:probable E3 ubiquitin-protein ligase ARI8 [Coffea eugenioides]|uniref:RBR-type E3 ubiquitin transferase n=1 Tax=Coffea arabica TaxID=13443 RepID=A0A6P6S9S4_COFAR|nr:probable E3 ubiquitin-protein ligase ARI8 [Coffea arabica]XP_027165957.1 probable E3 ubiquitin-protein ligase ARI8 [Coffea eugenioides]
MESEDSYQESEDYYQESDQEDYSIDEDEEFNDDNNIDDDEEFIKNNHPEEECLEEKNYTVLKQEDIRRRLEDDIAKISSVLSVSREAAIRLLCRSNWSVIEVQDRWFMDEEKARKACGLSENKPVIQKTSKKKFFCRICLEKNGKKKAVSAACGHLFCKACWETYIRISINDGRGCLMLRCPQPSCGTPVGQDMINSLASDEEKKKYDNYLVRSFIEDKKTIKWCPAPGCDFAVEFVLGSSSSDSNFDVTCDCSHGFCWNCLEEAHSPADCEIVAKWMVKNSSESENMKWILYNSKPCPSCKTPIQKSQGCMHMTCAEPCRFQFCWLCLGPWSEHITGGVYGCNKYQESKDDEAKEYSEADRRERAKYYMERYAHHYERWAGNHSSRQRALEDRETMKTVNIEKLSQIQTQTEGMLKFIIDAWDQIVECRRVLKWSYAYGYYLPEEKHAKKELFEFLQAEAEASLERLHDCAENELLVHLNAEGPSEDFNDFRIKLDRLTRATRNYFHKLVTALGNGLSEVDS